MWKKSIRTKNEWINPKTGSVVFIDRLPYSKKIEVGYFDNRHKHLILKSIGVYNSYEEAAKFARKWMKRHPNG